MENPKDEINSYEIFGAKNERHYFRLLTAFISGINDFFIC
jgi:hypothetical protein